jgi:hypothetical protein
MIQTILIVLVAVVVLIVIIAVLALRYLRADDSDTFDDIPDEPRPARRPAEQDLEGPPAAPGRRPRQPEQVTEAWADDRAARTPDARAPSGSRDRHTGPRPAGPQRAASQVTSRREPAGSRAARASARPDGPESATSSWDSLSDVDYWAELAADKPEITRANAGPATMGRPGSEPTPDARAAGRSATRGDSGQLPVRERQPQSRPSQSSRLASGAAARTNEAGQTEQIDVRAALGLPGRYNGDAAASSPDVLGRHGQPRLAAGQRPDAPAKQQRPDAPAKLPRAARQRQAQPTSAAQPAYQARPPAPTGPPPAPAGPPPSNGRGHSPADNDPLTSPSFPAINASDSRSYRTRPSNGASQRDASGQHSRAATDPGATSHQFIDYSSAPRRAASQPDGYPMPPAEAPVQPAALASGHQSPAAPAANPYGSYVSQPQPTYSETARPKADYPSAGYPEAPTPSLAAVPYGGYSAGRQAAPADWNGAPAIAPGGLQAAAQPLSPPADGYLPAAGLSRNGLGGRSHTLNGIDYSSIRYDDPVYPDAQGARPGYGTPGYDPQYDQQGYRVPDVASGQDEYPAYPGYGNGGR